MTPISDRRLTRLLSRFKGKETYMNSHRDIKQLLFATLLILLGAALAHGQIQDRFAKFDGNRVHYQISGKGGDALVFVHGWTCNANFWRGQNGDFSTRRIIAVDLPGHGQSDKPRVNYTMAYFARSIAAVMEDAEVKRAVLVGHSMGTPVVRQFYRLFPEKSLALVIVDGGLRPFFTKEQMDQFIKTLRENYQATATNMVEGMLRPIKDENLKSEIRTSMLSTPDYVAASAMEGMADRSLYERDPIKVPVLAVLAKSPFWPSDTEQFLHSLAPNLEYVMWDNVSHFLMMEKPKEFNHTLTEFLAKNRLLQN
jgi:pimeloyl-ACP methyl ester carboxylesterase